MDQGGLSAFRRELETHQVIVELMSSSQLDFAQSKCGFSSSDQQTAGRNKMAYGLPGCQETSGSIHLYHLVI